MYSVIRSCQQIAQGLFVPPVDTRAPLPRQGAAIARGDAKYVKSVIILIIFF